VRVEPIEVSGDDRYRYGERQYAGDGARRANQLADVADGHLVAVADRRHGNDRPPERVRDAVDLRAGLAELGVVDEAGEDEKADEQRHEEHAETFQTRGRNRRDFYDQLRVSIYVDDYARPSEVVLRHADWIQLVGTALTISFIHASEFASSSSRAPRSAGASWTSTIIRDLPDWRGT